MAWASSLARRLSKAPSSPSIPSMPLETRQIRSHPRMGQLTLIPPHRDLIACSHLTGHWLRWALTTYGSMQIQRCRMPMVGSVTWSMMRVCARAATKTASWPTMNAAGPVQTPISSRLATTAPRRSCATPPPGTSRLARKSWGSMGTSTGSLGADVASQLARWL